MDSRLLLWTIVAYGRIKMKSILLVTEDIDGIAPETVSTIEVLKGPDASAYGTRGANGVIVIKRRTGKEWAKW